jgi:hypothetical protein
MKLSATLISLLGSSVLLWAHPSTVTGRIVELTDDQVVVKLRSGEGDRILEVSPMTVRVTFKHHGESTEGTYSDLREGMFCNIRLDHPDGVTAVGFVAMGAKPEDDATHIIKASESQPDHATDQGEQQETEENSEPSQTQ